MPLTLLPSDYYTLFSSPRCFRTFFCRRPSCAPLVQQHRHSRSCRGSLSGDLRGWIEDTRFEWRPLMSSGKGEWRSWIATMKLRSGGSSKSTLSGWQNPKEHSKSVRGSKHEFQQDGNQDRQDGHSGLGRRREIINSSNAEISNCTFFLSDRIDGRTQLLNTLSFAIGSLRESRLSFFFFERHY